MDNEVYFYVVSGETFEEMNAPGTLAVKWFTPEMF